MVVIERVLGMGSGYVLDFSDRTFDAFIAHEANIDATAPRFSVDGGSKAKRLRRILHSLGPSQQAHLLTALLRHRDASSRPTSDVLDEEWRQSYLDVVARLEAQVAAADASYSASAWTGRRTIREQIAVVRGIAPLALQEVAGLADLVEKKRFNDPVTADAIQCLRELHRELGELIEAVDRGTLTKKAVESIEANRLKLLHYLEEGAKLTVVAPAMTFGIAHILAWITGVQVDSTMVSTVFGSVVGLDALTAFSKKSSLASA